jgi:hypothetical protein
MSDFFANTDRLFYIADLVCDERASESDLAELDGILLADKTARDRYLNYCRMYATLELDLQAQRAVQKALEHIDPGFVTPLQVNSLPTTSSPLTETAPSPTLSALGAIQGAIDFFSLEIPFAYLVATILFGIGSWLCSFVYVSVSDPKSIATMSPSSFGLVPAVVQLERQLVGQVTGLVNCHWSDSHTASYLGRRVAAGDEFALASGLAEITYDTGAKVLLQGPVTYQVDSPRGGFLSVGKLTARVEKKEVGDQKSNSRSPIANPPLFAVRTPTAVVTDLGTEFGIEVNNMGETQSHVFRGSVQLQQAGMSGGKPGKAVILHANEAARVYRQHGGMAKVGDKESSETEWVLSQGVFDTVTFVREMPKWVVKNFDLVDAVAGGNGFSGLRNAAINPVNGQTADRVPAKLMLASDGKYHRVTSLPFIDGVFIPCGGDGPVQLDSAGHCFNDFHNSGGGTSDYLWALGQIPSTPEFKPLRTVSYRLGDIDYASAGHGTLFMHANKGITFDLNAIRRANPGCQVRRFLAVVGNTFPNGISLGNIGVFVDGQRQFQRREVNSYTGDFPVAVELNANSRFLTLTATDCGSNIGGVWIVFGDPRLELVSLESPTSQSVGGPKDANIKVSVETESSQKMETANRPN